MTPDGISAIDAIKPALYRTKRVLFQPFRFAIWWRFAVLAFLTGEMSSGGGNPGGAFNYRIPSRSGDMHGPAFPFHFPPLHEILPWIILAALVAVVLIVVLMWIGATLRFVLFESVITGQPRIREGWRKWNAFGNSLFVWQLIYMFVSLAIELVFIGLPVLAAWRAGVFRAPREHLFLLIFGGLAFACVMFVVFVTVFAVWVLTKDFVVPMMAGEGLTPGQAWRRLWSMVEPNKGSYAGYLGMKVVLAITAGIGMAIVYFIALLIIAIPAIIIGVLVAVMVPSGHLAWTAMTITLAVILGLIVVALLIVLMAMVAVPVVVFFQGYAIHFFSTRYEPLYRMLFPPQAPPQAPLPTPA
jgi:hypothetical protein